MREKLFRWNLLFESGEASTESRLVVRISPEMSGKIGSTMHLDNHLASTRGREIG